MKHCLSSLLLVIALPVLAEPVTFKETQPKRNYEQIAKEAAWPTKELFQAGRRQQKLDPYTLQVKGGMYLSTYALQLDGREVYSWEAESPVFVLHNHVLYRAEFSSSANGCSVVAFDLKAGKQLWHSDLQGIGRIPHFGYHNQVFMELLNDESLMVYGKESQGNYVEIVELKTGKTLANRRVSPKKDEKEER